MVGLITYFLYCEKCGLQKWLSRGVSARGAAGNSIQLTASATLLTYRIPRNEIDRDPHANI